MVFVAAFCPKSIDINGRCTRGKSQSEMYTLGLLGQPEKNPVISGQIATACEADYWIDYGYYTLYEV